MRVAVLTIGDELLQGVVVDTNFTRLAAWFAERGHPVVHHASTGDDIEAIGALLVATLDRADLVVVSGGLGPTPDDVTVHAVARALGRRVVVSTAVLARLEAQYRRAAREMVPATRKIAEVVESAELLDNPVGQAPCQWIGAPGGRVVVLLPGVPPELAAILDTSLGDRVPPEPGQGRRTFRTVGIPESRLAQDLIERGVTGVAYLPWSGGVDVRIPASAPETTLAALREVAGHALLGEGRPRLEARVVERLAAGGETLAVAESVTGGRMGATIVSVPGASDVFAGGVIAYSNEMKRTLLDVAGSTLERHGAVSEAVVREMALGIRARTGASWTLATSGIAGPTGGSPEKPVGLVWFALCDPGGRVHAYDRTLAGDREGVIARSVVLALDGLRRALEGCPLPGGRT